MRITSNQQLTEHDMMSKWYNVHPRADKLPAYTQIRITSTSTSSDETKRMIRQSDCLRKSVDISILASQQPSIKRYLVKFGFIVNFDSKKVWKQKLY